jgi:plastocyanin
MTKGRLLLLLLVVAACCGIALAVAGPWRERLQNPPRTVRLSMSGYTFNGVNPTLSFKPGERIHFIVTNDESTQVLHNFRIVGLGVPCGEPFLPGGRREVDVVMPASGEFAYTCCTHPGMGGKLVIADR